MALFCYEKILINSITEFTSNNTLMLHENKKTKLESARILMHRFISHGITYEHGITAGMVYQENDGTSRRDEVPTVYENALLMPILKQENYNPSTINRLGQIILDSKRNSGFWNFFQKVADLDTTSLSLLALFDHGMITEEACRATVFKMFKKLGKSRRSPVGVWESWFSPRENQASSNEFMLHLEKVSGKVRVCVGVVANALFLLARLNMESDVNGTKEAVEFVAGYLDKHLQNLNILQPEMYYYNNDFVMYYFVSRYVIASSGMGKSLGKKLALVLLKRLEDANEQDDLSALNIALLILCTIHMNLHKEGDSDWQITKEEGNKNWETLTGLFKKLLENQRYNGSFPECHFYRWSKNDPAGFGGSEHMTTAFALSAINAFQNACREF